MVSEEDLVEIVLGALKSASGRVDFRKQINQPPARSGKWGFYVRQPYNPSYTSLPAKRIFLSERDIKGMAAQKAGAKTLKIPKEAIVSPLADDWLYRKGIELIRE